MYTIIRRPLFTSFSPPDIANLAFWYKSDAITGLSDGDSLTTWNDESGNSRNLTQSTSTNKPTYKNNGTENLNGLPVVKFDGTSDFMQRTYAEQTSWPQYFSIFFVVKSDSTSTIYPLGALAGDQNLFLFEFASATNWAVYGYKDDNTSAGADGNTGISSGAWTVVSAMRRNGTIELYANGATTGSTATTGTANSGASQLVVGSYLHGPFGFLNGYIAEIIVYFSDIGDTDRQTVQNYLGSKWNISIS